MERRKRREKLKYENAEKLKEHIKDKWIKMKAIRGTKKKANNKR